MYEWCSLHQSRAFNFAKIPSNLVRLDELGPSADTSAKRKSKQVLRLTAVWEIFAHWTSLKEMCKIKFHYFQKNSEPVDLQHKNEFLLYIFIEYTILLCKRRFATNSANQLESQQLHTPYSNDTLMTNRISWNIAFSNWYNKHILACRVHSNAERITPVTRGGARKVPGIIFLS